VYTAIPSGFIQQTTCIEGQLHTITEDSAPHDEAVCVLQWDGQKPYVEVLKGDLAMPKLAFLGWPSVDKVTYEKGIEIAQIEEPIE
jgi:hypothetical protein